MKKFEIKRRIEKLKKEINYHRYLYHTLDKQEISDAALDSLKRELFLLEQKNPEFITPDSPTQRIGGKPLEKFKKVRHRTLMLSLNDVFDQKELEDWQERIRKLAPREKFDYFAELKIDGFAVSLIYRKGIFFCGSTRGDGKIGEDVTQNLKTIESIPLRIFLQPKFFKTRLENKKAGFSKKRQIHYEIKDDEIRQRLEKIIQEGDLEIRGEVYMTKKAFERVNQERRARGESTYANPRNTAAGSIRQLDPKIAASRDLEFLAYDLITDVGQKNHSQEHEILPALGFRTDQGKICQNLKEVIDFFKFIQKEREKLDYQIDGIVVSVNNNQLHRKLGVVGKAPRGSVALKFPAKETTTRVEDIKVQVGRTGALTPVAHLKPVEIDGATISRATLHNEDEIKRLDVRIGDTVIIQRAGDVIPDIIKVLPGLRTGDEKKFQMPKHCPMCGSEVRRIPGEVAVYCSNENCFAKEKRALIHFVGRGGFNIEGLGEKIIEQLMNEGLISSAADIFYLKKGDLEPLERFAEKSAENLIEAIEKAKKIPLARFIYALGIRYVGEETANLLAQKVSTFFISTPFISPLVRGRTTPSTSPLVRGRTTPSISPLVRGRTTPSISPLVRGRTTPSISPLVRGRTTPSISLLVGGRISGGIENLITFFQKISLEELENIQDIGPVVGKSIYQFFHNKKNLKFLKELDRAGVEIIFVSFGIKKEAFFGKTFVLTGSLKTLTREQAKEKIRNLGGDVSSSVSKNTDYLICGEKPGTKLKNAKELKVKILDEKEFLKMMK